MSKYKESRKRTIVKTLLLPAIVFGTITFFVMVILGQDFGDSISFALLDIFIELVVHYIYERIWMRISWGITIKGENDPDKTYPIINPPKSENKKIQDIELQKQEHKDNINISQ